MPASALALISSAASGTEPALPGVVLVLLAYLIGSLSGSLLLGRLRGVDIREQGSGNAGGTNALRTQGARFALGVVVLDIGKGALATWLAWRYAAGSDALVPGAVVHAAALAAVIGHVWPLWHGFRGGKGVATLVGSLVVIWPWALLGVLALWLLVLVISGYVSLASICGALLLPVLALSGDASLTRVAFACAVALLVLFTHRGNLARLRAGTESRFAGVRLLRRWRRPS